jgi:enamine deaminase RidA (YjgF/YER057c/UK114 family)
MTSSASSKNESKILSPIADWLFIAGQDAVDVAQQTLFVGDLRSQTEQCVRQLQFIMEAAGGTLGGGEDDRLVSITLEFWSARSVVMVIPVGG